MTATSLTSLERYELTERIAVGGMAEVFRAKAFGAHGFEKTLAIKRILPELAKDPEFEERFIGEAKLAVKLSHANVVQVLDFGRLAGSLFIAMEFVDGLDLAALLKRWKDKGELLPLPATFHMAVEIARGLDFAHQHGVVHRDVSPSNILISRAGEVKIADFGIALAAGDPRAWAADRRRIMGKWRYMSPEQARGEPLTTQSDLFSAASVMFEMFTGDKLFPGDDPETIIGNICRMPIPRASERRPSLPPRLDDVLGKALEREPRRRPDKSAEMLRALIEISYESSIVASALDVTEAVLSVLAGPTATPARPALDELIRQQLGPSDAHRRTAVGAASASVDPAPDAFAITAVAADGTTQTAGTLVKKGVDKDGVTRLELDSATVAAAPAALRTGRMSGVSPAIPAASTPAGTTVPSSARRPGGRRLVALAAGLSLVGGGALVYGLAHRGAGQGRVSLDGGAPAVDAAHVDVDSTPRGATVWLDGVRLAGVTPVSAAVVADAPHRLEIALDGYRRVVEERLVARVGERVRVVQTLNRLTATLRVTTHPDGASVLLGEVELGATPLERTDLSPGRVTLTLRKPDFRPEVLDVTLEEGAPVVVDRTLKSALTFGKINLNIEGSWAEVSVSGKPVGRAPGTLRLPVGKHSLRLYNPASQKERLVEVEVFEDRVEYYSFAL